MFRLTLVLLLAITLALPSVAGMLAGIVQSGGEDQYALCSAETMSGYCNADTDLTVNSIYTEVSAFSSVTIALTETGSGSSCDAYGMRGLNMGPEVGVDFDPALLAVLSLTNPTETVSVTGFSYVYVECAGVGSTTTVLLTGE